MSENRTARWKRGGTFVGKIPFGYIWNREKKAVEINPKEAKIYQRIVDLYLHEGLSDLNISLRLKEEGIKLRGRKFPATQTIAYMLRNPSYYGHAVLNRHEYKGDRRTGKMKPASQHITFPMPALISKTEWDLIQEKRQFNKAKAKRVSLAQDYFLRDLLVCDECGGKLIALTHSRPRKDNSLLRYYTCYHHQTTAKRLEASGRTRCRLPLINAEQIEGMVWSNIVQTLTFGGFEMLDRYHPSKLEALVDADRYDEQIQTLEITYGKNEEELAKKELAKERLFSLLETDEYNRDVFRQKLTENADEILRIKSHLADIQAKTEILREAKANNGAFIEFVRGNQDWLHSIRQELDSLSPTDKKRFVESLVDGKMKVWVGRLEDGEVGPEWTIGNFGFTFNQAIFETLASEGKLSNFTKNGGSRNGSPAAPAGPLPASQWLPPGNPGRRKKAPPPEAARGGAISLPAPNPPAPPGI
jgi:hypothetical protein